MITIYLVLVGPWDDIHPVVAFTTKELAETHAEQLRQNGEDATVEELKLMDHVPLQVGTKPGNRPKYEYDTGDE